MRFLSLFVLHFLVSMVYAEPGHSGKLHAAEKVMFYQLYQIETIIGGERTIAPGCVDCDGDFNKFAKYVTAKYAEGKMPFDEPTTNDVTSMRTQWNRMIGTRRLGNAAKWLKNREVMPSIPESTPLGDQHAELYNRAGRRVGEINTAINALPQNDKKVRAQALFASVKIAAVDIPKMRNAGYQHRKYMKVLSVHQNKVRSRDIHENDNGGTKKAKELDKDAMIAANSEADMRLINETIDAHNELPDTESHLRTLNSSRTFASCM